MSDNGHFKVFRKLFHHPSFVDSPLEYKWVLITILDRACYKPCQQDDHGVLIDLQPGQYMTTIRELTKLAKVKEGVVQRSLGRFSDVKILRQEVLHTKTIVTISREYFFDDSATSFATTSLQDRYTKEEVKKQRKNNKQHTQQDSANAGCVFFDEDSFEKIWAKCQEHQIPFTKRFLKKQANEFGLAILEETLFQYHRQKEKINNPEGWFISVITKTNAEILK